MIRPAGARDAAAIARLTTQLGYPAGPEPMHARLSEVLGRDDHVLLLDDGDTLVLGWIHGAVRYLVESDPYVEIGGLVVDEEHRGQGVGRRLLEALEAWARQRGLSHVRVRSNVVRQDARRFYEHQGYRIAKRQAVFDKRLPPATGA